MGEHGGPPDSVAELGRPFGASIRIMRNRCASVTNLHPAFRWGWIMQTFAALPTERGKPSCEDDASLHFGSSVTFNGVVLPATVVTGTSWLW